MKHNLNRISVLVLALLTLFCLSLPVYAHDVPDLERPCSVTFTIRAGETPVSGGTLTIYRVGEIAEDDGNYSFQPTGQFTGCGLSFDDLSAHADAAAWLMDYAEKKAISGQKTETIDKKGSCAFSDLDAGLYLLVQHQAAAGYNKLAPFLVSLPTMVDGEYVYDLTGKPKPELEKAPETTAPTEPKPTDPKLPQTGQLNWPVPLLAVSGMALFAAGWVLAAGKGKKNES